MTLWWRRAWRRGSCCCWLCMSARRSGATLPGATMCWSGCCPGGPAGDGASPTGRWPPVSASSPALCASRSKARFWSVPVFRREPDHEALVALGRASSGQWSVMRAPLRRARSPFPVKSGTAQRRYGGGRAGRADRARGVLPIPHQTRYIIPRCRRPAFPATSRASSRAGREHGDRAQRGMGRRCGARTEDPRHRGGVVGLPGGLSLPPPAGPGGWRRWRRSGPRWRRTGVALASPEGLFLGTPISCSMPAAAPRDCGPPCIWSASKAGSSSSSWYGSATVTLPLGENFQQSGGSEEEEEEGGVYVRLLVQLRVGDRRGRRGRANWWLHPDPMFYVIVASIEIAIAQFNVWRDMVKDRDILQADRDELHDKVERLQEDVERLQTGHLSSLARVARNTAQRACHGRFAPIGCL